MYYYSNSNFFALASVVERVTGETFEQYLTGQALTAYWKPRNQ